MKKILTLIALAALVLVACKTKKPTAETVSAEAAKAATALVQAVASGDEVAIKEALAAKQNVLKTLKINDDVDLDALFENAFDVALEDNGVDQEEIDAFLKVRGIELPVVEKAAIEGGAAETTDKAEEIVKEAADQIAADAAAKAAEEAAAAQEPVEEVVEDSEIPFILVQQKPGFDGGDENAFSKWVNSQIVYPEAAKASGKEGRVVLKFVVAKDGSIQNVRVIRSVDPELDAEAVRVVSSAPAWAPGFQNGEPVAVSYVFPVVYKLQ